MAAVGYNYHLEELVYAGCWLYIGMARNQYATQQRKTKGLVIEQIGWLILGGSGNNAVTET